MSEIRLTKPDLVHVRRLVELVKWILDEYPELLTTDEEDTLKIVDQLITEKLNENTYIRY